MAEVDPVETAMLRGAALVLRRRAERQAQLAVNGTTGAERGAVICSGEAAIALRLAATLGALADEFESEAAP